VRGKPAGGRCARRIPPLQQQRSASSRRSPRRGTPTTGWRTSCNRLSGQVRFTQRRRLSAFLCPQGVCRTEIGELTLSQTALHAGFAACCAAGVCAPYRPAAQLGSWRGTVLREL